MSINPPKANVDFVCEYCGVRVQRYQKPSRGTPRFCSARCHCYSTKDIAQTPDHVAKRARYGEHHHHWAGDAVSEKGGRTRAIRVYDPQVCVKCGASPADRHHSDGNTANNSQENIAFLCRHCHMELDGRLALARERIRIIQPKGVEARWSRQ
jgi:ribosomal protein L40E